MHIVRYRIQHIGAGIVGGIRHIRRPRSHRIVGYHIPGTHFIARNQVVVLVGYQELRPVLIERHPLGVNVGGHSGYLAVVLRLGGGGYGEVECARIRVVARQIADATGQGDLIRFARAPGRPGYPTRLQPVGADGDAPVHIEAFAVNDRKGLVIDAAGVNGFVKHDGDDGKRVGIVTRQKIVYVGVAVVVAADNAEVADEGLRQGTTWQGVLNVQDAAADGQLVLARGQVAVGAEEDVVVRAPFPTAGNGLPVGAAQGKGAAVDGGAVNGGAKVHGYACVAPDAVGVVGGQDADHLGVAALEAQRQIGKTRAHVQPGSYVI